MTSPAGNTEPTAEQVEAATALVVEWGSDDLSPGRLRDMVARALAAAVHAERENHCPGCEHMCRCGYVIDSPGCFDWHNRHQRSIREVTG